MKVRRNRETSPLVIGMISVLMLLGMGVLAVELWQLQIPRKSGFEAEFLQQSVRRVRLPAVRGKIYDTHGLCLADSVPNYCIAIYTEEMRAPRSVVANTLELLHEVWARVGHPPDITYQEIQQHLLLTPNEPLVAWKNLDDKSLARWKRKFEEWTAPTKGSRRRNKVAGLDLGKPVQGRSIVLETAALKRRGTSTAANTLELVYEISERIGIPRAITFQHIKDHIYARRPLPLLAWKNIDKKTMARWADSCSGLAGTDIFFQADRHYPEGENLAHLIGFTLEAASTREEAGERVHFDLRGIEGKKGLEGTYNKLLEGEPGSRLVQIDVSGFHHRDLQVKPPRPGGDLQLTIDARIQRFAQEALALRQEGEPNDVPVRGAVVVLDPNNGDVLALVSAPSFDPNTYMRSKTYRQSLLKDTTARTYHRAVFGQYPPGSIFKPIVSLGALKDSPDYDEIIHTCKNPYHVGKRRMKCWVHSNYGEHGELDLREALMYSCNVYMFEMAQEVGFEPIHDMAQQFGFGQYAGLFPDLESEPAHKTLQYGNLPEIALNPIDLCNMSIGQGAITVSPLQMAMATAAIANGGTLYRPRLVKKWRTAPDEPYSENPTWANHRIDVPIEALELVRAGMYDVVQEENGTAKKARVPGVLIAGKTGSAQYRTRVDGKVVDRVHTWMISYAPFDFPRYAIAFLVEDGVSGGKTIGPRLSALYQNIFEYDGTIQKEEG